MRGALFSERFSALGGSATRAIFISYRRQDAEGEAGRLYDDLTQRFGESSVFMDVSAIEAGRDFRKAIDESVSGCGVLLAIIGPGWLEAVNERGERRLEDPGDFVRMETASALRRDIPVVPVLVRSARMPRADRLPEDIRDLAYRNAVELTHARWKSDVNVLMSALRSVVGESGEKLPVQSEPSVGPSGGSYDAGAMSKPSSYQTPPASSAGGVQYGKPGNDVTAQPAANSARPNPSSDNDPLGTLCNGALDADALARITRELARYIGPIAEIVVKRAAKRCATVADLRRLVAEEIDGSADRTRFLDACR